MDGALAQRASRPRGGGAPPHRRAARRRVRARALPVGSAARRTRRACLEPHHAVRLGAISARSRRDLGAISARSRRDLGRYATHGYRISMRSLQLTPWLERGKSREWRLYLRLYARDFGMANPPGCRHADFMAAGAVHALASVRDRAEIARRDRGPRSRADVYPWRGLRPRPPFSIATTTTDPRNIPRRRSRSFITRSPARACHCRTIETASTAAGASPTSRRCCCAPSCCYVIRGALRGDLRPSRHVADV